MDGDHYADIVISAQFYDGGEIDEGKVWLYRGTPNGLALSPSWSAEGNAANAQLACIPMLA